jgi:hypothetical protein
MWYTTAYPFKVIWEENDLTLEPEKLETDIIHLSVKWSASIETTLFSTISNPISV